MGELKKHSSHRVGRRISDLELKTNIITFKINTAVIKKFKNIVFLNSPNSGKTHELFHSFFLSDIFISLKNSYRDRQTDKQKLFHPLGLPPQMSKTARAGSGQRQEAGA